MFLAHVESGLAHAWWGRTLHNSLKKQWTGKPTHKIDFQKNQEHCGRHWLSAAESSAQRSPFLKTVLAMNGCNLVS